MIKNDIVADIKIKEKKAGYYQDLDSYKNIEINKLIALLKLKYGDNLKVIIDKIFEKAKITNTRKEMNIEINKILEAKKYE